MNSYSRIFPLLFLAIIFSSAQAQDHGFEFGKPTTQDLVLKIYEKDTTASALILNEFGEAHIDNDNEHNLIFEYHATIKILRKDGLNRGNFELFLRKNNERQERLRSAQASSFTINEQGFVTEKKLETKSIFKTNHNQHYNRVAFAVPNVKEGSIVEVKYVIESPFIYNFRPWDFQSDIPKKKSEFRALIPANYKYNISLHGYLKLEKEQSDIIEDCFTPDFTHRADCALYEFGMSDIPAFKEEEYMTAASNYRSAINFELEQIDHFSGRKDKITKEWKDVEIEIRNDESFGLQLKRSQNFIGEKLGANILSEKDLLTRCKKIHAVIRDTFTWNGNYGMHSESGIKKAFDAKRGNIGDINLCLIVALQQAGLDTEPMILSTRDNGEVADLFPVISDFNYVVAKVNINGKVYLVDATNDFLPFDLLPLRCLNGRGRVLGKDSSYWHEIQPIQKQKNISNYLLNLNEDGSITGSVQITHFGYNAAAQRKTIAKYASLTEYAESLEQKWKSVRIKNLTVSSLDAERNNFSETFDISIEQGELGTNNILFNPFFIDRWDHNPFKAHDRLYPVNFAVPQEQTIIVSISFPETYELAETIPKIGLSLPADGGRLLFGSDVTERMVTASFKLVLNKSIYTANEYSYLRELFSSVVQIQNSVLLFRKK